MRRRRKQRGSSKKSIIYIGMIMILSFIGVGYGMWSDDLDIFPSFRDNIPLDIIDKGSVPVALYNVDTTSYNSIAELEEIGIVNRVDGFYEDADTIINSFLLNIEPKNDYKGIPVDNSASIDIVYDTEDGLSDIEMKINIIELEVNRVEEEISILEEELNRINRIERHNFTYELQFEQGIL